MMAPNEKLRDHKSDQLILKGTWMSLPNFMSIHLIVVKILHRYCKKQKNVNLIAQDVIDIHLIIAEKFLPGKRWTNLPTNRQTAIPRANAVSMAKNLVDLWLDKDTRYDWIWLWRWSGNNDNSFCFVKIH